MDPLTRYRRAQRETRRLFDPFTREHCPTCPTPCCRKPARIRPVDLILVEELGYRVPGGAAERLVDSSLSGYTAPCEDAGAPCDYLGADGCSFPADLRPFGRELRTNGKTTAFLHDDEANAMMKDSYRAPYVVPDLG